MSHAWLRLSRTRVALFGAMALVHGCAPASQRTYAAPSDRTVAIRTEAAMDGRTQYVVVENQSTVPITVTSFTLTDCENIKNRCETTRMRLAVPPGQRRRIATVQPANLQLASNFRYSWTWGAEGVTPPLPGQ